MYTCSQFSYILLQIIDIKWISCLQNKHREVIVQLKNHIHIFSTFNSWTPNNYNKFKKFFIKKIFGISFQFYVLVWYYWRIYYNPLWNKHIVTSDRFKISKLKASRHTYVQRSQNLYFNKILIIIYVSISMLKIIWFRRVKMNNLILIIIVRLTIVFECNTLKWNKNYYKFRLK